MIDYRIFQTLFGGPASNANSCHTLDFWADTFILAAKMTALTQSAKMPATPEPGAGREAGFDLLAVDRADPAFEDLGGMPSCAWFVDRGNSRLLFRGLRTQTTLTIMGASGVFTLLRGGALLRGGDGSTYAAQPAQFASQFARAFSDGTAICALSDTPLAQAIALGRSNKLLGVRSHDLLVLPLLKRLMRARAVRREEQAIGAANDEIRQHLRDLHSLQPGA